MLTANDIRNMSFSKGMGGYKTAEVDAFKEQCADTVSQLAASKAELEKKLEVLADKLMEYRNDEDNIRSALLNAQRLGDSVIREAKQKAGLIMEDAKIKAENMQESARRNIKDEERELERIRREVTNFKMHILSMYREHLALIDVLPELREEEPKKEQPKEAAGSAEKQTAAAVAPSTKEEQPPVQAGQPAQILQPVFEPVEQPSAQTSAPPEAANVVIDIPVLPDDGSAAQPAENAAGSSSKESAPVSRFGDLKFGENYDISKDSENTSGIFKRRR